MGTSDNRKPHSISGFQIFPNNSTIIQPIHFSATFTQFSVKKSRHGLYLKKLRCGLQDPGLRGVDRDSTRITCGSSTMNMGMSATRLSVKMIIRWGIQQRYELDAIQDQGVHRIGVCLSAGIQGVELWRVIQQKLGKVDAFFHPWSSWCRCVLMRQRWSSPWISSGVIKHDFLESLTFGRRWADRMWNWSLRSLKEDEAADE
jgi:hypothetical protein